MIVYPNDACPLDMEPEDFMEYLIKKSFSDWTKDDIDWCRWWLRGRPETRRRLERAQELQFV